MVIGTRQQLCKLLAMNIKVGSAEIKLTSQVKNLGCCLDSNLCIRELIRNVFKAAFFYSHNIRRKRRYLSNDSLRTLVHAFITSRLDYCNGLLNGHQKEEIAKLQRVQKTVARLVMGTTKFSPVTPVLHELHWLPVQARIHFKILLLALKDIHGLAPAYILAFKCKSSYNLNSN